jgi:hypothetical protein
MADAPYVNTSIPMYKSQHISKRKNFWIQKILLEESVHMYEILRVLDMARSYPNVLFVCRLWYEGERFTQGGKATTSERYGCTYYIL